MVNWRDVYKRFCRIEKLWPWEGPIDHQVFKAAITPTRDPQTVVKEARSLGVELPDTSIWEEILELRRALELCEGGRHLDDPLDDAYHAAVVMKDSYHFSGMWGPSPDLNYLYRGQREHIWPVNPLLYRNQPDGQPPIESQVEDDLATVRRFVRTLQGLMPDVDDEQGVAIAQHYSKEAGTKTWLIDMTWNPFVALFFASSNGKPGDRGVVICLVRKEWERFSSVGTNRVGAIRIIAPEVPRIEAQRALFIDTSHPDFFEQYVPYSLWFWQKDGLIFEDREADPPITRANIYPEEDPVLNAISNMELSPQASPLAFEPCKDALERLDWREYFRIVQSWFMDSGVTLDEYHHDRLVKVCKFHAECQANRASIDIRYRGFHRLKSAAEVIYGSQYDGYRISMREALGSTFSGLGPADEEQRKLLESFVRFVDT